jgi:hypothetical protein
MAIGTDITAFNREGSEEDLEKALELIAPQNRLPLAGGMRPPA